MSSESKEFSAREVAKHNTPRDAWLSINGKVYDVSSYVDDHPGGGPVLIEAAGTDASEAFEDAGHSEDAHELMEKYLIGTLQGYVQRREKPRPISPPATQPNVQTTPTGSGPSKTKMVNLGLLTVVTALAGYFAHRQGMRLVPRWLGSFVTGAGRSESSAFSFLKGLLLGGSTIAATAAYAAQRFTTMAVNSQNSFTRYPPHIKVPKRVPEDTLLQRGYLDPLKYTSLPLEQKTRLSPNVFRYRFTLPRSDMVLGLPIGQHVVIKAEVDGESVARSYTPVSNNADRGVLELVVKSYPDGKLTSGYLEGLAVGDEVSFRGPKGAMRYRPGLCKQIGMVAGGTGITPMFQIIRAICEDERDLTHVSLLYANRTEEDILLRDELDRFARRYPDNLSVHYVLDTPPEGWTYSQGYVTKDMMAERLPPPGADTKAFLCGPPGMVAAAQKSLVALGFEAPAASSKMTDQIFVY